VKSINKIRERINIKLFESKTQMLLVLRFLHILISLSAVGSLVYYYGFPQNPTTEQLFFNIIQVSFGFYVLRFFIKILYDFHPWTFIKTHWLEALTVLLLTVEGLNNIIFGRLIFPQLFVKMGFDAFEGFSMFFVQGYFLMLLIIDLRKNNRLRMRFKIHPALLFLLSILALTFIGAGLLLLPEMSTGGIKLVDALFMSMSSVSVTGLSTVDVSHALTFKGQVVIMGLIKLGGLNTIAFGALLLVAARFGVGIKYHEVVEDFLNRDSITSAESILTKIVIWATTIEVVGIVLLYIGFGNEGIFADEKARLFHAVFHGFSGFNNAGISILEGGMMHPDVINNYFVHTVLLVLFFLGGFGMIYLFDLFEFSRLRERMQKPWKTIEFGTKISLYFTVILLLLGAVIFYIFEYNNTLKGGNEFTKIIASFYQSMTTRNAGFNVVDTAKLSFPVFISFLFLMFVGASSGSAGGGIRTSTFAIMWASLVSTIRGKKNTELFKRTISNDLVLKAYAVFLFFVAGNVIGPFALSITEHDLLQSGQFTFLDLVFEHVSAASTVGLSTGITPHLSEGGKYVLILAMFIGRVGTLTLAYLLGKRVLSTNYKYPTAHTMVG
jgi:trk system potassium uptake protein